MNSKKDGIKSNVIKSVPQKSGTIGRLYDSEASRKYQSYQSLSRGAKSQNTLKRDFVNEMIAKAKEKQVPADDGFYKSYENQTDAANETSGEYSRNYPRGVTLSKTFTKASSYKSGSLKWNKQPSKFDELTYGPSNIFNHSKKQKPENLTKYSHVNTHTNGWMVHDNKAGQDGHVQDEVFTSQPAVDDVTSSVIDESYYKNILKSSKLLSKPSESSGEIDINITDAVSPSHQDGFNTTYSKPILKQTASSATTKTSTKPAPATSEYHKKYTHSSANRPDSALSLRAESVLSQATIERPDSALSIQGVKQNTGSKKSKSSSKGRYRTTHTPSYVDEMLFGKQGQSSGDSGFEAPWGEPDKMGKKPLPYVAITSMEPHLDRKTIPPAGKINSTSQTSTTSAKYRPVSASTKKKQTKELHNFKNTYIDETLFGKRDAMAEESFKAPWDKGSGPKPHTFDGTDYKSGNQKQRKVVSRAENQKPVWK